MVQFLGDVKEVGLSTYRSAAGGMRSGGRFVAQQSRASAEYVADHLEEIVTVFKTLLPLFLIAMVAYLMTGGLYAAETPATTIPDIPVSFGDLITSALDKMKEPLAAAIGVGLALTVTYAIYRWVKGFFKSK